MKGFREQLEVVSSLLPSWGQQAWWQVHLPTDPSCPSMVGPLRDGWGCRDEGSVLTTKPSDHGLVIRGSVSLLICVSVLIKHHGGLVGANVLFLGKTPEGRPSRAQESPAPQAGL